MAELCRVANRMVVVDYSDVRSFNIFYTLLFPWKKKIEGNTRTFLCFKPGEVPAELARHGFGRTAVRRQFFVPMVVHRALSRLRISRGLERASRFLGLTRAFGSPVVLALSERKSFDEDSGDGGDRVHGQGAGQAPARHGA